MKVKVLKPFWDMKELCDREIGDTFEATKTRADEINGAGFGQLVEVIPAKRTTKKVEESE